MSVRVQREDFDIGAEVRRLAAGRTDIGAIVTFTGTVRSDNDGNRIAGMTLEHYPGMTESELARVEAEAGKRWPLQASLIVHRVGATETRRQHRSGGDRLGTSGGRLRRRRVPDGLPENERPVLEEGAGARWRRALGRGPPKRRPRRRALGSTQIGRFSLPRRGRRGTAGAQADAFARSGVAGGAVLRNSNAWKAVSWGSHDAICTRVDFGARRLWRCGLRPCCDLAIRARHIQSRLSGHPCLQFRARGQLPWLHLVLQLPGLPLRARPLHDQRRAARVPSHALRLGPVAPVICGQGARSARWPGPMTPP